MLDSFRRQGAKFKFKLIFLVVFTIILFFSILDCILQNAIKEMKEDINTRFNSIEHNLNAIFQDAEHSIYNIAESLSEEEISVNNKNINKMIGYTLRSSYKQSIPLAGLILLDANGDTVVNAISNSAIHNQIQASKNPICLKLSNKKDPFELKIFSIRKGVYIKKLFVPLAMTITDINKKYIGTICAGISAGEISKELSARLAHTRYLDHINIINKRGEDYGGNYIFQDVESVFTVSSIIRKYLKNHEAIVHRDLKNYPFTIEMEIKTEYFKKSLRICCLFFLEYLGLFIIFSFLLYLFTRNYYRDPLLSVNKKLFVINEFINKKPTEILVDSGDDLLNREFYPDQFAKDIDSLIDSYYLMEEKAAKQPELEMRQRILNLMLTEHHFLSSNESDASSEEKLYINKLISIIDEKYVTMSLMNFLTKVTEYCCEFYHEINLRAEVQKKDQKDFTFKHAALTEAIFSILTFIIRGNFDIHSNKLIIRGRFNKDDFPSITVEVSKSNEASTANGWSFGPTYTYTSLLSIYLLARENSLFFDIKGKDDKMIFSLEPIDKKMEFNTKARLLQVL